MCFGDIQWMRAVREGKMMMKSITEGELGEGMTGGVRGRRKGAGFLICLC